MPRSRLYSLCVACLLAMSACGSDGSESSVSLSQSDSASSEIVDKENSDTGEAEQAEDDENASDPAGPDDECRLVAQDGGDVCIPVDPERIVVFDAVGALPALLAVGAPIVGATGVYSVEDPWPHYFPDGAASKVEVLGTANNPNFEQIAALNPDVIVTSSEYPFVETLAEIAPTLVSGGAFYTSDWESEMTRITDALGFGEQYQQMLEESHQQTAEVAKRIAEIGELTVTRVDDFGGVFYMYENECIWIGSLFAELGLTQPEAQRGECTNDELYSAVNPVSHEQFELLEADLLLVFAISGNGSTIPETVTSAALWSELEAVQAGQAFAVDDAWGLGVGVWAIADILDDISSFLDVIEAS